MPNSPLELLRRHRIVYDTVYGVGEFHAPPVASRIAAHTLTSFAASFSCRPGTAKGAPPTLNLLEPNESQGTFSRSAEQFAAAMFQNIQQVQAQQQEMFKFIISTGHGQRQVPNSFAAPADRTPGIRRNQTGLTDGPANDTEHSIHRRLCTIESLPDDERFDDPVSFNNQDEVSHDRLAPKDSAIVPLANASEQRVPSPGVQAALDFLSIARIHGGGNIQFYALH